LTFYIEVSGFDSTGEFFRDRAVPIDVSDGGCQFELTRRVEVKTPISIQVVNRDGLPPPGSKPLLFEVARVELSGPGCVIGAMQLQTENIWRMTFPLNRMIKSRP
jgi:hypothetical protein